MIPLPSRSDAASPSLETVGRYVLEAEIGKGGMGRVYRARDEATGRVVALKRNDRTEANVAALFEREYRTLATIRHPRIIEAFDFGVDGQGRRFYTMELLHGESLKALAPIPWAQVCGHLRDVAASLALLHAQRLVHRDVTPSNIRLDGEGRAKLLDFGALATFGGSAEIVGTAAFMAPEVARGLALDHRADLFSLGATAYYLLTGRPPHPVRGISELEEAWATPPPPLAGAVPGLPEALDRLILSMLSVDPLARPSSAAEVITRLGGIAGLGDAPVEGAAEAYLGGGPLIGRAAERAALTGLLQRTRDGAGGAITLSGSAGVGRSRMGQEAVLEARLRGMTSVRVETLSAMGQLGVARALVRQVLEVCGAEARSALGEAHACLGDVFEELRDSVPSPARTDTAPDAATRRDRTVSALVDWFAAISTRTALLVVVDDAHAADSESIAFLLELSHAARKQRIAIVATVIAGAARFPRLGTELHLSPLDPAELAELVSSVFGDVPHLARLIEWLQASSGGNPGHCFLLLRHLAARKIIRYASGAWVLPQEMVDADLPAGVEHAWLSRLQALPEGARRLAEVLALHRGIVSLELSERAVHPDDHGALFSNLFQLVSQGFLVSSGSGYRFGQDGLRAIVEGTIAKERLVPLHLRLGEALVSLHPALFSDSSIARLEDVTTEQLQIVIAAGWHLLRGGLEERGAHLLKHAAFEMTARGEGIATAVPALEAALAIYRARGHSRYDIGNILMPLALASLWVDWRLAYRYAGEALEIELEVTGITRARRWARWLGPKLGLYLALLVAVVLYHVTARGQLNRKFSDAFAGLVGLGLSLTGVYSILLDFDAAEHVYEELLPLASFPAHHPGAVAHRYYRFLIDALGSHPGRARRSGDEMLALLTAPGSMPGFPQGGRKQLETALHATLGGINSLRVDGAVFDNIRALELLRLPVFRHNPASLLARHHLSRGETALYEKHSERLDVYAAMGDLTWREDIIQARRLLAAHSLTGDVVGLKRVLERLDVLAAECPSLACLREAARATYLSARGDLAEALPLFESLHRDVDRERGVVYSDTAGAYAEALNRSGDHARAREVASFLLSQASPEDLEFRFKYFNLDLQLAIAEAHLGEGAAAQSRIERALAEAGSADNPLILGFCHQAAAHVARLRGDVPALERHLQEAERWFRQTGNPALIARSGRLELQLSEPSPHSVLGATTVRKRRPVEQPFEGCSTADDRVRWALARVLDGSGARAGWLYLRRRDGSACIAPSDTDAPPESLAELAAKRFRTFGEAESDDTAIFDASCESALNEQEASRSIVLAYEDGDETRLVGVVILAEEPRTRALDHHFISSLARALDEDPDIVRTYLEPRPGRTQNPDRPSRSA